MALHTIAHSVNDDTSFVRESCNVNIEYY